VKALSIAINFRGNEARMIFKTRLIPKSLNRLEGRFAGSIYSDELDVVLAIRKYVKMVEYEHSIHDF